MRWRLELDDSLLAFYPQRLHLIISLTAKKQPDRLLFLANRLNRFKNLIFFMVDYRFRVFKIQFLIIVHDG